MAKTWLNTVKRRIEDWFGLFVQSGKILGDNEPLMLASSTAFFTLFSIPPTIIISVNVLSLYFKQASLTESVSNAIGDQFGENTAEQMSSIAQNFSEMAGSPWITVAGSIFLAFVATNLFKIIRISINQIWKIKVKGKKMWLANLKKRGISLGIILVTGILFIVSTLSDSLVTLIGNLVPELFGLDTLFLRVLSKALSILLIGIWFTLVFRFLPDARAPWRALWVGALVTSILFNVGKYFLERFLINSDINNIFETSTSVVLIMLFIFYSSIIIYYGVSFTYVYARHIEKHVRPHKRAAHFEIRTLD